MNHLIGMDDLKLLHKTEPEIFVQIFNSFGIWKWNTGLKNMQKIHRSKEKSTTEMK